jgi:acyl-coenzyme A synthetase/AMP-(fatty) acid ligase
VDPAFLPRPLLLVDALPRNEVGKLPRERVLALLREHRT